MDYKIDVFTANNNIVGRGSLADENTFKFYGDMLGIYKNSPWLHDNIIYFIPGCDSYKDGCFKISDVVEVYTSGGTISVKVGRFFLLPMNKANALDEFECGSGEPLQVATIDLTTGNKIS